MRRSEAELEMNPASRLRQLHPVQLGRDGGGGPEMQPLSHQRDPLCLQGAESLAGEAGLQSTE